MATHTEVKPEDAQGDELIQLVSFMLENEEYGVRVLKAREIIRMLPVTRMPNMPPHVEGIINLRGKIIPIVSLRRRFNLIEKEPDSQTRIIIMDAAGTLTGFVVDAVSEVIRVSSRDIQPPPAMTFTGSIGQEFISGVISHTDRLLIIMDIDRMFSDNEQKEAAGM